MVNEDVPEDRELRIDRRNLAEFGTKRRAKSLQGSGGVQLGDFIAHLPCNQLALEICNTRVVSSVISRTGSESESALQCSCFPVRTCPGGTADCAVSPPLGNAGSVERASCMTDSGENVLRRQVQDSCLVDGVYVGERAGIQLPGRLLTPRVDSGRPQPRQRI